MTTAKAFLALGGAMLATALLIVALINVAPFVVGWWDGLLRAVP